MPRSSNGIETDPITFFHVIETIASADASTGWCLSQAGGCSMSAAYLSLPVAQEIFGDDPRAVLAWGPGPKAKAVEVRGRLPRDRRLGLRLGRPACHLARRALPDLPGRRHAQARRQRKAGRAHHAGPHRARCSGPTSGTPSACAARLPTSSPSPTISCRTTIRFARLRPAGERAPRARAALPHVGDDLLRDRLRRRGAGHRPRRAGQLHRYGQDQDRARRQEPDPRQRRRADQPRPGRDRCALGACLSAAVAGRDLETALGRRRTLSVEDRIVIRGASTNAIHKAREAVDFAYNAAGATAIFGSHPLERRFRDIHTVTQQLQGRLSHFETVGAWMMGADTDLTWV